MKRDEMHTLAQARNSERLYDYSLTYSHKVELMDEFLYATT